MSLTINLVLFKRKKKKNGEIPIYLRITENRKSRYKSTGISVLPKHWNKERQRIRGTHTRSKVLNDQLEYELLQAEKKKSKLKLTEKLSADNLKNHISDDKYNSFINCAERYLEELDEEDRYWEHKRFKVLLGQLKDFMGNKSRAITKVDAELIEKFQNYLLTEPKNKEGKKVGNSPNTVRRKLRTLKGMFNSLLKAKKIKHDPFLMVNKVKEEPVEKTKLSLAQIKAIEKLDLEKESQLWHSRNYFMFSFYNAGIRFGDMCTLKWKNLVDGRLVYKMRKTGSQKSIKQYDQMDKILSYYRSDDSKQNDYIFPILDKKISNSAALQRSISSKNVIVNRDLKKIAGLAEIEANISFHVSRHSFSQYALEQGLGLYEISKALGHSKLKTTERYLKSFDEELLDEGMDKLFNNG
ncbi:site-specific integrase [Aliifodinibius salicampi]|uniref:Site-specific integrase n=1 Tax=Fodinibius salicampi TaxID=1920655 RepID=A0ABT3Q039_9BACT|nr:site-specific integrase [Fodinibius salicampi]MCW9713497.1 site-specific integrase [Fodinibius salicampi]